MYVIAAFAVVVLLLSLMMRIRPYRFAAAMVYFSRQDYFHPFEIISHLVAAIFFIRYASDTQYPELFNILGIVLLCVSAGLSVTPARLHKKFAVKAA